MKAKTRNLLGFGALLILIILGVIGYGAYSIFSFSSQIGVTKEVPEEIKEAKIIKGEGFLTKTEFFKLRKLGFWQTILKGASAKDDKEKEQIISSETAKDFYGFADVKFFGNEIIAVGKFGGYIFDLNGNLKREFLFEPQQGNLNVFGYETTRYYQALSELQIVELAKDKYAFLTYDSIYGINIYDQNGNTIWKFGNRDGEFLKDKPPAEKEKEVYVTKVLVGDLDDDGIAEYLISQKNDGIRVFDQNGKEKWFQPDEYPVADLRIIDLDGDGKSELFEFQGKSSIIRDKKTGNALKKLEIDGGKEILPIEDIQQNKPVRFFDFDKNKLKISDLNNKTILESDAPLSEIKIETLPKKINLPKPTPIYDPNNPNVRAEPVGESSYYEKDSERVYEPQATWVSLKKDKPKYLAIVASFISIPRSNFYIYDEKGVLIYHELLPEDAETIAVLPNQNGLEEILVGGKDTIWKFSAN